MLGDFRRFDALNCQSAAAAAAAHPEPSTDESTTMPGIFYHDQLARHESFNDRLRPDGTIERDDASAAVASSTWRLDTDRGMTSDLCPADQSRVEVCYSQRFANLAMAIQAIALPLALSSEHFIADMESKRQTHLHYSKRDNILMTCQSTFGMRHLTEQPESAKPAFSCKIQYSFNPEKSDFTLDFVQIRSINPEFTARLLEKINEGIGAGAEAEAEAEAVTTCCAWLTASQAQPRQRSSADALDISLPLLDH